MGKNKLLLAGFFFFGLLAGAAQAQTISTCAQFQSANIATTPGYYVQTNFWNPSCNSSPTTQCMTVNVATGDFAVTAGNFTCGDNVTNYPSIVYGCQSGGSCSPGTNLPIQVSALQCVTSSWAIGVTNQTGSDLWDAAYDIWFCSSNTNLNSHSAELMIWMNYMPGTGPAGSFKASGVTLGNSPTAWTVYEGPIGWNYIAFMAETPNVTSFDDVDILAFINYCVSKGYIQSAWYLSAIEAGIEMRTGGVPFTSSRFNASVNVNTCGTPTPAFTATPTSTNTPCGYPGNTCTPTNTPTPSNTPTATPTPFPNNDIPWPNPWDGSAPLTIQHSISTPPDSVELKVYTISFRKVCEVDNLDTGTTNAHPIYTLSWNQLGNVSNGLYYLVIVEKRGRKQTQTVLKLLVRR